MSESNKSETVEQMGIIQLPSVVIDMDGSAVVNLEGQRHAPTVLDPGLRNTAIYRTGISYINGRNGTILYRGYSLGELVRNSSFSEVACLLLNGKLPTSVEIENFENATREGRLLQRETMKLVNSLPEETPPLMALSCGIAALRSDSSPHYAEHLIGLAPSLIKELLRRRGDRQEPDMSTGSHLMAVLNAICGRTRILNAPIEDQLRLLDILLLAHAEHGMNCSTTAVRVAASARASAAAAVAAGVLCFSGRFHGGAADRVAPMLHAINESELSASEWLDQSLVSDPSFRLYGFGHRVYRTEDPRAAVLRAALDEYIQKDGYDDPYYETATKLADAVVVHPHFRNREIFPNVDLYSGSCFRALGIPGDLNSTVIAMGRMAGWLAHWREASSDGSPIIRPKDLYDGNPIPKRST
jgi:citrate synthase